jgi:signal transduction histidine kinase
MLALEVRECPAAVDLVQRIQSAQDRLQQLYEEVRQYAAPVVLRREVCSLRDLVDEAWADLEPAWKGRAVSLETPSIRNLGVCLVDRYAIERVFRNILENSLAACADPMRIQVRCEDVRLGDRPAVRIRFRDNGSGLNAEQRQKIFEPFYTTKTQGTGLGMAISKRIVEAHGGRIAVGDSNGSGAEVLVTLPKE